MHTAVVSTGVLGLLISVSLALSGTASADSCNTIPSVNRVPQQDRVPGWYFDKEDRPPHRSDVKFSFYTYLVKPPVTNSSSEFYIRHDFCNTHTINKISFKWETIGFAYNGFPANTCDCYGFDKAYDISDLRHGTGYIQYINSLDANREPTPIIEPLDNDDVSFGDIKNYFRIWIQEGSKFVPEEIIVQSSWNRDGISLSLFGSVSSFDFVFDSFIENISRNKDAMAEYRRSEEAGLARRQVISEYSEDITFLPESVLSNDAVIVSPRESGTISRYPVEKARAVKAFIAVFTRGGKEFITSRNVLLHAPQPE